MNRILVFCIIHLLVFSCFSQTKYSTEAQRSFKEQNYDRAISFWKKELSEKNANQAMCFFNIANCMIGKKEYSRAILNYEKALKLDYNHEAFRFNLKVARAKLGLSTDENSLVFNQWIKKILYSIPSYFLEYLIVIFSFLLLILVVVRKFFLPNLNSIYINISLGLLCLFAVWFFCVCRYIQSEDYGVIVNENCVGYLNTTNNGKSSDVPLGRKVEIKDEFEEKYQIVTEKDTTLWIEKSDLRVI